jgi:hypothetical protein
VSFFHLCKAVLTADVLDLLIIFLVAMAIRMWYLESSMKLLMLAGEAIERLVDLSDSKRSSFRFTTGELKAAASMHPPTTSVSPVFSSSSLTSTFITVHCEDKKELYEDTGDKEEKVLGERKSTLTLPVEEQPFFESIHIWLCCFVVTFFATLLNCTSAHHLPHTNVRVSSDKRFIT